jgi:hypothetical protein
MTYPKLPDGPSPPGAAAVRALGDAKWQRKVGPDYVATVKDGFSRVEVLSGDTFVATGLWDATHEDGFPRASVGYLGTFYKYGTTTARIDANGVYIDMVNVDGLLVRTDALGITPTTHNRQGTQSVRFGTKSTTELAATFSWWGSNEYFTMLPYYYPNYMTLSYFGPVTKGATTVKKLGCLTMQDSGAVDAAGTKLLNPVMRYVYSDKTSDTSTITMPAGVRHYSCQGWPLVLKNRIILILFELPFIAALDALSTPKFIGPVWLISSTDNGMSWSTPEDIRGSFNRVGALNAATFLASGYNWASYVSMVTHMDALRVQVAIGDDSAIFATPYYVPLGTTPLVYYQQMVRITNGVVTPLLLTADPLVHGFITAMVYVGQSKLLAVFIEDGWNTDNVSFWYSTNNGDSWTRQATVSGFNCDVRHKYVGSNYLLVDTAASTTTSGTVLITAWDQTEGAYYVYATKDLGATWVRKGRVTDKILPATHDAVYGNYGYQYDRLDVLRGATSTRKLDPALPTRYALKG